MLKDCSYNFDINKSLYQNIEDFLDINEFLTRSEVCNKLNQYFTINYNLESIRAVAFNSGINRNKPNVISFRPYGTHLYNIELGKVRNKNKYVIKSHKLSNLFINYNMSDKLYKLDEIEEGLIKNYEKHIGNMEEIEDICKKLGICKLKEFEKLRKLLQQMEYTNKKYLGLIFPEEFI